LLDIVEEAEAARVIVPEERNGEVHYSFAHELIRQTLLSGLSLLRRQRLHLAVADAMERTDKGTRTSRPSEIAHHLLQSGAAAGTGRTLDYLERAADAAIQSAAFEEALRAIEDALSIVDNEDALRRARLMERQGAVIRAFGRYDDCLSIWREVVETYAELGEIEAAGDLCWQMGYQLVWLNRFADAFATYARGLEILGDHRAPAKAALVGSTGLLTGFAGLYEASQAQLAEGEEIANETGDDQNIGRVNWARCIVDWSFGRLPEACASGTRAVEHLRRAGDLWTLTDALSWLSYPLGSQASFEEGEASAAEALDLAVRLGHIGGEILARRGLLLNRAAWTADLEELQRGISKDLELCLSISSPWSSQSYAWLANIATLRGQLDEGLDHADEAIRIEPQSAWSGTGWTSRIANRSYAGDDTQVRSMLDDKIDVLRATGDPPTMGELLMLSIAGEVSAVAGLTDVAEKLYPLIAAHADRVALRSFDWALTQRVAGMTAACSGDWDRADTHFTQALAQTTSFPNVLDGPQVQHWYGKMLLDRGRPDDRDRGRNLVSSALDGYRLLGIPVRARMAEQVLAQS
jgi:tetratricopeptide (TPR) repeat protein